MTVNTSIRNYFPGQIAVIALASAFTFSAAAQQPADGSSNPTPSATQPSPQLRIQLSQPPKEGFWGRVNPFARKKWVNKRLDPIKGQLNELDEVNAKNASDIKDVDARATAGINKAQTTADQANQVASAAAPRRSRQIRSPARQAAKSTRSNATVSRPGSVRREEHSFRSAFRRGSTVLSADAKKQLDDLAASLTGHQGYMLEMDAYAPRRGGAGIQSSDGWPRQ